MGRFPAAAAGAVLGLVAGLMYVGVMLGTPGALILVYLTQLPLFAAGLWLGVGAAVAAGGRRPIIRFTPVARRTGWPAAYFTM